MTNAEDAAVLIQILRDKPELLKTSFGMKAHKIALTKIKGTWWEKVLFSREKEAPEVKAFRNAVEDQEHEQALKDERDLRERKDKSVVYLSERRKQKHNNSGGDVA